MYNSIQLASRYARYLWMAANRNGHGIHSPFVFDFITTVLKDHAPHAALKKIELLRQDLLSDKTMIEVEDYGAGSFYNSRKTRTIAAIAKQAAKPERIAKLLFRVVQRYKPHAILELGTSLGISAAYMASGNPLAEIITIEGSDHIAAKAKENFERLQIRNVEVINGTFDIKLPEILRKMNKVDCAFIDGNHRKEPTLQYFNSLLMVTHNYSIIIFDDIHWSREMEQTWEMIKMHPSVTCTIDLFFLGLVFFRNEIKTPQHFVIRYPYHYFF